MARRSAKFSGSTLVTVWMLAYFNAVCLASKGRRLDVLFAALLTVCIPVELNTSTESGNSTAETNASGLAPEFLRPFATPEASEAPCSGENCRKVRRTG